MRQLAGLPPGATILDAGGWFAPLDCATHVVDLMPYETRRATLTPEPRPGERFTRATWHQVDFLAPGFELPFRNAEFTFAYCGHTLEDLRDPFPLVRELQRVARSGCVISPSRLSEQTAGVRDRISDAPGHPHHHWIIDPLPNALRFCAKADSLSDPRAIIPLRHFERARSARTDGESRTFTFCWRNGFEVIAETGAVAAARGSAFATSEHVRAIDRLLDLPVRRLRRLKYHLLGRISAPPWEVWRQIVELSRPFSRLPLNHP